LVGGEKADLSTVFKIETTKEGVVQIRGYNSGYSKSDVEAVIFPDDIDGLEANFLFNNSTVLKTVTFEATDTFFLSGDNIFSSCSVEKVTFNPDCVVEIRKGNFSGCKSLTEITFPKFRKLAGSSFNGCSNMKATNELILLEGMTEIGGHAFHDCTSLSGTLVFPSTLTKINEYSFQNTGFSNFDLSKCASLETLYHGGPFNDNDNITKLDLSGCTSLITLQSGFASNCDKLTEVILPPNLQTVPYKSFAHCYKLQSIVLPASVKYVADEAFHSARSGETVKTFTVYLQGNTVFHEKYPFRDSSAKIEYVLIGEGMTAQSFIEANTFSGITGASVVNYTNGYNYTVGQAITSHTIVENYCASLALTGAHASGDNPCVTLCTDCLLSAPKENPQHSFDVTVSYENGFGSKGVKITTCKSAGCEYEQTEEMNPLFTILGFSAAEYGDAIYSVNYRVNDEAIEAYMEITGETVNYGVFAVKAETIGTNDIFDENGVARTGVVAADITDAGFGLLNLKITGFDKDQKDIDLATGAFVKTEKDGTVNYSYLQIAPATSGKYFFASYNDVVKLVPSDEENA
jgi:hypothetical protein